MVLKKKKYNSILTLCSFQFFVANNLFTLLWEGTKSKFQANFIRELKQIALSLGSKVYIAQVERKRHSHEKLVINRNKQRLRIFKILKSEKQICGL